jgi:hypothetical protein
LKIARYFIFLRLAAPALLATGALAACSGGGGSPAAPIPAPSPTSAAAFAAPDSLVQSGLPAGYGIELDDDGNPLAAVKCAAPPPDPNTSSVTLSGRAGSVHIPCFKDFTAVATVPTSKAEDEVVKLAASTDKTLGAVVNKQLGTPIIYTSLTPNKAVTFTSKTATIVTAVLSPSEIAAPHTYAVEVYVPALHSPIQTVKDITPIPKTHEIKFSIATLSGTFPAIEAVVIVYRST